MQKKLIALAVAGLVAAPAFAATSNVDIYGRMAFSLDYVDSEDGLAGTTDDSNFVTGRDNVSRVGFKGSEDLGGGLAAIWQVENQLNVPKLGTSGGAGGGWAIRNTFVGVKSNSLGTVLAGRHDTPYKLATGKLDPFVDTAADYNVVIGRTVDGGAGTRFDLRADNTVAYISPTFSGFHAALAWIEIDSSEAAGADDVEGWSVMGMYENGPIFASLAYEKHSGGAGGSTATGEADAWKVGLGYTFGNAKIGAVYESTDHDDAAQMDRVRDAWYLSGVYTMGNIVLNAAYGNAEDSDAAGASDGWDYWAVGADYILSKRTKLFGLYTTVSNDTAAAVGLTPGYVPAVGGGRDQDVFSVGIIHNF